MKRGADWIAWSLQLIVGLAVGGFIGLQVIIKSDDRHLSLWDSGFWLATEHVPLFLWGAAFIGGGLASYLGDRLWMGSSYRLIPPDDPKNSPASRALSMFIGLLGVGWVFLAMLRQFQSPPIPLP